MFAIGNAHQYMRHAVLLKLLGHHGGLLIRHIRVVGSMNQSRWGIIGQSHFAPAYTDRTSPVPCADPSLIRPAAMCLFDDNIDKMRRRRPCGRARRISADR